MDSENTRGAQRTLRRAELQKEGGLSGSQALPPTTQKGFYKWFAGRKSRRGCKDWVFSAGLGFSECGPALGEGFQPGLLSKPFPC